MNPLLEKLGPSPFGAASAIVEADLLAVKRALKTELPPELLDLISETGSALMFDEGARFKPDEPSGLEDTEGFQDLLMLYGLADDEHGLRENNETYREQLPPGLLTIGESSGGNQICLDPVSGQILFWHHEAETDEESTSLIANNFPSFLAKLEPDNEPPANEYTVVSSRLDF